MSKEIIFIRRIFLTLFCGIAVMITSMRFINYRVPLSLISGASAAGADEWLFPGEYESHQAMWMLWPTYENKAGFPSTDPISDMIRAMSGHVHVNLAVQDADDEAAARSLLTAKGVQLDH